RPAFQAPPDGQHRHKGGQQTRAVVGTTGISIAGPQGYCIDRKSRRVKPEAQVYMLAGCEALGGTGSPPPGQAALLMAAVSPRPLTGVVLKDPSSAFSRFFRSEAGRGAVSWDGRAGSVRILGMTHQDGMHILHLRHDGPLPYDDIGTESWRGVMVLNGHMVTLQVVPFADKPLSKADGAALLQRFARAVRAAST
ncbi:hypothetical protein, partial [Rhodovulum imhoffii]|uniref:hypothetical protein n=1 Tax=Rhodovulum imhoffii TaxID=365340 RepID=UPI001911E6A9